MTQRTQTATVGVAKGETKTTLMEYDSAGQLVKQTLPDGNTMHFEYDSAHALRSISDSAGNQVKFKYDANGNRTQESVVNAKGETERSRAMQYDIRDQLKAIEEGDSIVKLANNTAGQLQSMTDPNHYKSTQSYDDLGRMNQTIDALGQASYYQYNINHDLNQIQGPNGSITQYEYDDFGNRLSEESPDRGMLGYQYDTAGNVVETTDAMNTTVYYQYDALNRLRAIIYPDNPQEDTYYVYDCKGNVGRLCEAEQSNNTLTYQYDAWGNVIEQQQIVDGQTFKTQYQYNIVNQMIGMSYPDQTQVDYGRDQLGQINTVRKDKSVLVSNRTYRADGSLIRQTWANGINEHRDYDNQGRMSIQSIGNLDTIHYTYDANGNVLQKNNNRYQYDPLNRLIQDNELGYQYDANGNRLNASVANQQEELSYLMNSNQLSHINGTAIKHDANGNLIQDEKGRTYHYNQAGRLIEVSEQGQKIADYAYNALGQRIKKTVDGQTSYYQYNLAGQLIQETTSEKSVKYIWVNKEPIAHQEQQQGKTTLTYIISDHLATPRIGIDKDQKITWQWSSDSFGETAANNDPDKDGTRVIINLRFPGQYADKETGHYYNWHRYYNPKTGRYITSDPIGLAAGINTYAYVGGNPNGRVDVMGLYAVGVVEGIGGELVFSGGEQISLRAFSTTIGVQPFTLEAFYFYLDAYGNRIPTATFGASRSGFRSLGLGEVGIYTLFAGYNNGARLEINASKSIPDYVYGIEWTVRIPFQATANNNSSGVNIIVSTEPFVPRGPLECQ